MYIIKYKKFNFTSELYFYRWSVETKYKEFKSRLARY